MGKIRARRRFSAVMICFALMLFAGSAFAFASAAPIALGGTANVNASLKMIISGATGESTYYMASSSYVVMPPNGVAISAHHNVVFTQPGQYLIWHFEIKNAGTIPTRIVEINQSNFDFQMCAHFHNALGHNVDLLGFSATILNHEELVGADFAPEEVKTLTLLVQWAPNISAWDEHAVQHGKTSLEISMYTEIIYEPMFD